MFACGRYICLCICMCIHMDFHLCVHMYAFMCVSGESGFNCWGVRGPHSCYSCFTWMYLECAQGLACPPTLWRYRLPGFFFEPGGLFLWFHPEWLSPVLLTPTFRFPVFPLLLITQRYNNTLECCLLGLFPNNNMCICGFPQGLSKGTHRTQPRTTLKHFLIESILHAEPNFL